MATLIQQKVATTTNNTANPVTFSATFDSSVTAGNFIIAYLWGRAPTAAYTVTYSDNKSNSWLTDKTQTSLAVAQVASIGSAVATTGGATFQVTVSLENTSATDCYLAIAIQEWSGVSSGVDKTAGQTLTGSQTTIDSSSTATTTNAAQLWVAVGKTGSSAANTITANATGSNPSSGWSADYTDQTSIEGGVATVSVSSTGAARHVWTSANAADTTAAVATYNLTGGSPPPSTVTWVGYIG